MLIDKYKDRSKLFLILCGSSMSYIEDHVLAYKAPLYGRRTAQFKILPFEFCEACEYFNGMSSEDKALAYGLVGGTPQYLLQINNKISIEDNIKNIFLNPVSALYEAVSYTHLDVYKRQDLVRSVPQKEFFLHITLGTGYN